jgi:hypothetical protein
VFLKRLHNFIVSLFDEWTGRDEITQKWNLRLRCLFTERRGLFYDVGEKRYRKAEESKMTDVEKLSLEELIDLNKRVVRRIEYMMSLKTRSQLDRFELGERVVFHSEGRHIEGVVIRVNRKTLSVKTGEGYWNIHPRFVTKLTGLKTETPLTIEDILHEKKDK